MATMTQPVTEALLPVYKRAPIELVRGDGVLLYDADGRAYIDFTSGIAGAMVEHISTTRPPSKSISAGGLPL